MCAATLRIIIDILYITTTKLAGEVTRRKFQILDFEEESFTWIKTDYKNVATF